MQVLLYGFTCLTAGRSEVQNLEKFQKKVINWITGNKDTKYKSPLRLLYILSLPIVIQLNDRLLDSKTLNENSGIELPEVHTKGTRNEEYFRNDENLNRESAQGNQLLNLSIWKPPKKI